jgi:hypothetical protein
LAELWEGGGETEEEITDKTIVGRHKFDSSARERIAQKWSQITREKWTTNQLSRIPIETTGAQKTRQP